MTSSGKHLRHVPMGDRGILDMTIDEVIANNRAYQAERDAEAAAAVAAKADRARGIWPEYRAWQHPGTGDTRLYVTNLDDLLGIRGICRDAKAWIDLDGTLHVYNLNAAHTAILQASLDAANADMAALEAN